MQTLVRLGGLIVVACAFIFTSCSENLSVLYRAASPDNLSRVEIVTFSRLPFRAASVVQLKVSRDNRQAIVRTWEHSDSNPCLASVAWSKTPEAVVVLYRDCWHHADLAAFDLKRWKLIDPLILRPMLADQIRSEYALPPEIGDPIAWAEESQKAPELFGGFPRSARRNEPGAHP